MRNTLNLRLPKSLFDRTKELADKENVSMDQLVTSAIAEKISAFMTKEYLEKRAKRGSRKKFDRALSKIMDVKPDEQDQL